MTARVARRAVLVVLATLTLAGCSRQVAEDASADLDLLAISPDRGTLPVPPPHVAEAFGATGGPNAWVQSAKLQFDAVVTAYQPDGSFYVTEQQFVVCPWGRAIRISAREPRTEFACQIANGQYRLLSGDPNADVSPLAGAYRDYAEAVLQIVTAPVRMLDADVDLQRRPLPVMIAGQWYNMIEATFRPRQIAPAGDKEEPIFVQPYWTQGIYYQNQSGSRVDRIWLASPAAQKFITVCGYDYAKAPGAGVLIPTKIEVFQSGADAVQGRRIALIDLKR